jgi:thymidylate synthase (FAD)
VAIDATQATLPGEWRFQAKGNRQGSGGNLSPEAGEILSQQEKKFQDLARKIYNGRLDANVAREQARKDLPLSTYTEAYWKMDLHNLLHFLSLRMDEHSQLEIRQYASLIGEKIVANWCPITWEAFLDYRMNAMALSGLEIEIVQAIAGGELAKARDAAARYGWLDQGKKGLKRNRERIEFEEKLGYMNLSIPWK